MILRKIKIENLGPFVGANSIDTKYSKDKPVFLIGGKNGAGKTTFFTAIKLCLYGCKAYGYEVVNNSYYKIVKKLFNDKALIASDKKFSVEVQFEFGDGENDGMYSIKRSWNIVDGIVHENYIVVKDSIVLDNDELNDFENLLFQALSPSMFDFYFFDGEKVSDLVSENGKSNSFKDAFIKLIGLDNLNYLVEFFKKNSEKSLINQNVIESYQKYNKKLQEVMDKISKFDDKIDILDAATEELESQIKYEKKRYLKSGGVKPEDLEKMNLAIIEQETNREVARKELRDYANSKLPFVILKKELLDLKLKLEKDSGGVNVGTIEELFSNEEYSKVVNKYLTKQDTVCFLADLKKIIKPANTKSLNNEDELNYVLSQIKTMLEIDPRHYINLENSLRTSKDMSKEIRTQLNGIHSDNFATFNETVEELTKEIRKNNLQKEKLAIEKSRFVTQYNELYKQYEKSKKDYECEIKKSSIHSKSALAYGYFSKLENDLISKKIEELADNFVSCFNSIINKKNLIDGIYVDKNLSIYPYRNISLQTEKINKIRKNLGEEKFIEEYGQLACNRLKSNTAKTIDLPTKINKTLSEGENQVYLMSLYFALSNLSRAKKPFIIDTPFGRIDKEHRENIIKNFLLKLNGQLIILSTDEEINESNISVLKNSLSSYCTFENTGMGKTSIKVDKYFGGKL